MDPRTYYWNLLVVWPLEGGLRFLASDLHLGGALAIVLFTILIRVVLFPLVFSQLRTQRLMSELQPDLDRLRKKHASDRARLNEETMALYRERRINPASGMLPLLLQMPILFGLYAALRDLSLHDTAFQAPWLWLHSLQRPDTILFAGRTLPGPLPVLAAGTQWAQQWLMTRQAVRGGGPKPGVSQVMMSQIGPLMMLWIGVSASAGLALYWITQNAAAGAQRLIVDRLHKSAPAARLPEPPPTAAAATGSGPAATDGDAAGSKPRRRQASRRRRNRSAAAET